jgi:hypothetical protein
VNIPTLQCVNGFARAIDKGPVNGCLKLAACCRIDCSAGFDPKLPVVNGGYPEAKTTIQSDLPGVLTAGAPLRSGVPTSRQSQAVANFAMASAWMPAQSMSGKSVSRSLKASARSVPPSIIASTRASLSNLLLTAAKTAL